MPAHVPGTNLGPHGILAINHLGSSPSVDLKMETQTSYATCPPTVIHLEEAKLKSESETVCAPLVHFVFL